MNEYEIKKAVTIRCNYGEEYGAPFTVSYEMWESIRSFGCYMNGRVSKVEAIKIVRTFNEIGLKEAKMLVEAVWQVYDLKFRDRRVEVTPEQ